MNLAQLDLERWQQIDYVFQLAVARAGNDREAFLDTACGEDTALRAQVESLLAHDLARATLLDEPQRVGDAMAPPLSPGDRLGPWTLGRPLGEGAAGLVFEAERSDQRFERRVAVKVSKLALLSPQALERFRSECRILARLEHPAIARLYDVGLTPQGLPYLVLEHVDGQRLDTWCRERNPSLAERLTLFQTICGGVAFAHRNLVVHRDLKPSNILVTADGQPKLLDFGIARLLSEADGTRLTRSGLAPMTPQYASPEQLRGEEATTLSDVYSLGLVLFELLTGRLPYRLDGGSSATATSIAAPDRDLPTASSLAGEEPWSSSPASLRGDLDTVTAAAVAIQPQRRYSSVQALADDLDRFRAGQAIAARPPTAGYLVRRFVGRHRWAVAAAASLLILLAGFAVTMTVAAQRLATERDRAASEAATAQQVVGLLGGLFEGAEPAVHQGRELTARELLDRGAAGWDQAGGDSPATRAALGAAIGKAYLELSLPAEARRFLEPSLALRTEISDLAARADSRLLMSRLEWAESRYALSLEHATRAAELFAAAERPIAEAEALAWKARAAIIIGQASEAEEDLQRALTLLGPDPDARPALGGLIFRQLGSLAYYRSDPQASEHLRRAVELSAAAQGPLHPDTFEAKRLLADELQLSGTEESPGSSLALLEDLLRDQEKVYGEAHEQMVWTLNSLGASYLQHRDMAAAEGAFRRARTMLESISDSDHLAIAVVEAGLAQTLWEQGRSAESVPHYERAVEITRRNVEPDSYNVAVPSVDLAAALADVGRCAEAVPLASHAEEVFERESTATSFVPIFARWLRGFCLAESGDAEAGRELISRSVREADAAGFSSRPRLAPRVEHWRRYLRGEARGTNPANGPA